MADDHQIVREGIKLLVSAQPDMEVVGEADNGAADLPVGPRPAGVDLDATVSAGVIEGSGRALLP